MSNAKPSIGSYFRNRFVQSIMLSGLFLQIGIWVRNFAILFFVVDQTGNDPYAVSLISVAEFAPIFIFSFIGGTFADRWRPKRTMVWCDLLSAASIGGVLLAMEFGSWKTVFFVTFVSAILSQFSQPSGMKLFKQHVPQEQMQLGMSMYQTMFAVFMILGPILGTFSYQKFGIYVSIGVMGVAFLLSAAALAFLPADREPDEKKPDTSLRTEMKAGIRYVLNNRILVTMGGAFLAAGLAIGLLQTLGIFLVTERLGLPKEHLQWFMTVNGVAMIVGGGLAMGLAKKMQPQNMLTIGMAVNVVTISVMGFSTLTWVSLTAQFFSGLVMPAIQIGISTTILNNTEEAFVGRVNGVLNPLFIGAMVVTMSVAGVLKDLLSIVAIYQISAALFVVGVLLMLPLLGHKSEPLAAHTQTQPE